MTILKQYDETGKEIGSKDVEIDASNIDQYIEQYGIERALGYMNAYYDLYYDLASRTVHLSTHSKGSTADKFLKEKEQMMAKLQSIIAVYQNKNISDTEQSYVP